MYLLRLGFFAVVLLAGAMRAPAPVFLNLDFESTRIINDGSGMATVPWWSKDDYMHGATNFVFNALAMDAPMVSIQTSDSYWVPAIQGNYSVFLQGGTISGGQAYDQTNGVSIFQTGRIPNAARSLIFDADASLQVSFAGQRLWPVALSNGPNYTVWGVNIYQYGEQTGELRFTAPWLSESILDDIRFSAAIVPEPSIWALSGLSVVGLLALRCWRSGGLSASRGAAGETGLSDDSACSGERN